MLARLTNGNQLVLPPALLASFPGVDCFSATEQGGRIVLSPVRQGRADEVRDMGTDRADEVCKRLEELGITKADVQDAVAWARHRA